MDLALFCHRFVEVVLWGTHKEDGSLKGWDENGPGRPYDRAFSWRAGDYQNSRLQIYPRAGLGSEWYEVNDARIWVDGFAVHLPERHKYLENPPEPKPEPQRARIMRYRWIEFEQDKWKRSQGGKDFVEYESTQDGASFEVQRVGNYHYKATLARKDAKVFTNGDVLIVPLLNQNDVMDDEPVLPTPGTGAADGHR
ncbi:MAG: hypothetical protein GKS06_11405 [Acidobacteria bacterium]|nr:hypothetical protein [Acidobacteriota bacterium]